jgi:hypothetical protein
MHTSKVACCTETSCQLENVENLRMLTAAQFSMAPAGAGSSVLLLLLQARSLL